METVGLGGGCHWCTEGVFQSLRGVEHVEQGYLQSDPPWEAWAEGVLVRFDPETIGLDVLIEVHLRTHSGQSGYSPGGRYRSAVYTTADGQAPVAAQVIARLKRPATLVLPLTGFRASEERFRDYYRTDPNRPFCRRYIDPKLDLIRREFATYAL